ncbi:MAG: NnrS family protein [Myxococcales bacterium]|nr:NnrS family protein [Myxococcales bacterium]
MLLATGFRPFFLLAALLGAAWVPLWIAVLVGYAPIASHFGPVGWHSHEMIFGYAAAVIAGFLLTAVQNWTGRRTAHGAGLLLLCLLWLGGRLTLLFSARLSPLFAASIDCAFLPALGVFVARPLFAERNRRNYAFVALIALMTGCNVLLHLAASGVLVVCGKAALAVALDIVLVMIAIVGGRIVPLFTRNALPAEHKAAVRERDLRDTLAIVAVVAVMLLDAIWTLHPLVVAPVCALAGLLNLARLFGWGGSRTLRQPILWVLHVGYAALGAGLLLRGIALGAPALLDSSVGTHVLTIGSIGLLTLGMMSRVALGHTGRALRVPRPVALAFGLLALALVARALWPLISPRTLVSALWVSAVAWAIAFITYLACYARILVSPRADGKPG